MKADGNVRAVLEEFFRHTPKPSRPELEALGKQTNRKYTTLYRWFLKRRNHIKLWKRKVPSSRPRTSSTVRYVPRDESSSEAEVLPAVQHSHRPQLPYNVVIQKFEESPEEPERFSPDSPSSNNNANQHLPEIMTSNLKAQNFEVSSVSSKDFGNGFPDYMAEVNDCLQDDPAAQILGGLSPQEISVLENVFSEVPNPSRGNIARLAARFVKEQDKRIQITNWFAKRRSDVKSNDDYFETGSDMCL